MGREAETVARIFISFRWRGEGEREGFFSSWKYAKQNPSKPTWNHCHGARIATSAFRLPLPIILSNKLIVMPVQIFIMNQLTGRFSIGSISRKHFPIWRNNRRSFSQRCGNTRRFFFLFSFFPSFLFFERLPLPRMNVRYSLTIGKLSNRQISVSISSLESISNVSEWKFRSVSKIDDEKNEKKRKKERNGIR